MGRILFQLALAGALLAGPCATSWAQTTGGADDLPWFTSVPEMEAAVAQRIDAWFESERRYLANFVRVKLELDGSLAAVPSATVEWFRGPIWETVKAGKDERDGEEGGKASGHEERADKPTRVVRSLEFYTLLDQPVTGTITLHKTPRRKEVAFRAWVGRRHLDEPDLPQVELARDDALARLHADHPGPFREPGQGSALHAAGRLGDGEEDATPWVWLEVDAGALPPLVNVLVWNLGSVLASGTKKDIAARAETNLRSRTQSGIVLSSGGDDGVLDGPIVLLRYTKPLKRSDTLEPVMIYGEEKNSRAITLYFAAIGFGAVRASALEGLFDMDKLLVTGDFRRWSDVFGQHDFVRARYRKANFMTLDKFNIRKALYQEQFDDHARKEKDQRRRRG